MRAASRPSTLAPQARMRPAFCSSCKTAPASPRASVLSDGLCSSTTSITSRFRRSRERSKLSRMNTGSKRLRAGDASRSVPSLVTITASGMRGEALTEARFHGALAVAVGGVEQRDAERECALDHGVLVGLGQWRIAVTGQAPGAEPELGNRNPGAAERALLHVRGIAKLRRAGPQLIAARRKPSSGAR